MSKFLIGLDVGSTTVKAVVVESATDRLLWSDYQRHETRQAEKTLEMLKRIEAEIGIRPGNARIFVTGSGGSAIGQKVGAKFVQEVNAVSLAVEKLHPDVRSVIELGGQDAKMIFFQETEIDAQVLGMASSEPAPTRSIRPAKSVSPKRVGVLPLSTSNSQAQSDFSGSFSLVPAQGSSEPSRRPEQSIQRKKKIPTMNDKCAGGTGVVIDKINAKLKIPADQLSRQGYTGIKLHPVAGKCGVFAESDINSLQKMGIPNDELMASLFESLVLQNLSVLTRGNTLRPVVLLLGGPNFYIRGMQEAWRDHIPKIWEERGVPVPARPINDLIQVPENAQYYAAIGAVEYGRAEEEEIGHYKGFEDLEHDIRFGRATRLKNPGGKGLVRDERELALFLEKYRKEDFTARRFKPGTAVEAFIGLDGGSTSTKAVLLGHDSFSPGNISPPRRRDVTPMGGYGGGEPGFSPPFEPSDPALPVTRRTREVIAKAYQLSQGNPIEDTIEVIGRLRGMIEDQGCTLQVQGIGVTGYAKDILKETLAADVGIVETVAHTESALHEHPDADVIVDVGGQDIKVMLLKEGRVKDFKLNTQCSAGNGYFLQSTAQGFGFPVEEFADRAFQAKNFPEFGYGCAVFLQTDIVDFQRQGWRPEEIMAGLANVLPKNIWLYVCQIPNLSSLGRKFVLQGGTQHNLAAVKAEVDYIESRCRDKEVRPEVVVHPHCGEAGAIGAAIEAARLYDQGQRTRFIGLDRVSEIRFQTTRNEETRCYFCKNKCLRTFIDVETEETDRRIIIASCEKGSVEDVEAMRKIKKGFDEIKEKNPNLAQWAAENVWKPFKPPIVADPLPRRAFTDKTRRRIELMKGRAGIRIGIPRLLNLYSTNPLFSAYFESLGIPPQNLVYSDFTDEKLYRSGAKRGAIDPCFPSKVGIPHIHNLLFVHHPKRRLDYLFFPMMDDLPTSLSHVLASRACPTVTVTPEAVKAAFVKEGDLFREKGIAFLDTFVNVGQPRLFERQMYHQFVDILGLSPDENARAVAEGYRALRRFDETQRGLGRQVIERLEKEDRLGIVLLGRPYHNDPGINHGIPEEFQKRGYPILTQDSLPTDDDLLDRLFGDEVEAGLIKDPLDIGDVWKNCYSENTNRKVWAAKFTARHPNLVALELSGFKCGHDGPIYTVVEEIVERSGTPYFCFKDIDENKSTGAAKIRLETIDYFLARYQEERRQDKQRACRKILQEDIGGTYVSGDSLAGRPHVPRPDRRDLGLHAEAGQVDLVGR